MRGTILLAVAVLLAASACRTGKAGPNAGVTATATNDATPRDIPTTPAVPESTTFAPPRHLVFAPGETIASDDFGIFFLDPVTGAAEGFVTAKDQACGSPSARSDGRKLFYYCKLPPPATPVSTQDSANSAVTYVLDTVSGDWSPFTVPAGSYGIIAPDGGTLTQAARIAIGLVVERTPGAQPRVEQWAPDSRALVVDFAAPDDNHPAGLLYLIRMDSSDPIWLTYRPAGAMWSPDSSKFVLTEGRLGQKLQATDAIIVIDARGRRLWSRDAVVYGGNPRWSPDLRWLGVQVLRSAPSDQESNPAFDVWVFDGATGEPAFRVLGAIACAGQYWTADDRLVVGPYGSSGDVVVDPVAGTLFQLDAYVTPSPTDPDLGIWHDLNDFYAVNLKDGSQRLIAHTTVYPAWDFLHEPLFAGSRIMFRSQHGGHGGCAEGSPPSQPPRMELQFPPFPNQ